MQMYRVVYAIVQLDGILSVTRQNLLDKRALIWRPFLLYTSTGMLAEFSCSSVFPVHLTQRPIQKITRITTALSANQKPILPSSESQTPRGSRPIKMLVQNWDMVRHMEGQLTPQKYPSLSKISPPTLVKTRQRLRRRIPLILPLHPPY